MTAHKKPAIHIRQLGFAPLIAILIAAVLIIAGGSGYCFYKNFYKSSQEKKESPKESPAVFLKMEKSVFDKGETVEVLVSAEQKLFTGFPAFEVYQLIEDEWQRIDVHDMTCALSCSADETDICQELPIACAPLPEHCQDFDPSADKFEWDQTFIKVRKVECPNLDLTQERFCSFWEKAQPGKYKVSFQYSENCLNETLFLAEENNVQKLEKEFEIK